MAAGDCVLEALRSERARAAVAGGETTILIRADRVFVSVRDRRGFDLAHGESREAYGDVVTEFLEALAAVDAAGRRQPPP